MNKIATLSVVLALFCAFFAHAQITPTSGIVYVKANGSGNGSGWNSATGDLQAAINANGVTKVFVAIGNYPSPAAGFVMKNNVAIYGGFDPANGITTLAHNRILPTEDIEGAILNGESTKRIITNDNNGLNNTAILDGFTIRNGYANGFGREGVGGGIYNNNSSPTFFNLVIRNNLASNSGGGIANFNSPIILNNTLFLGNNAIIGGGIFNQGSNTSLSNVIFKGNTSGNMGGVAIYSAGGTTTVTNALITGNYQLYYITSASNANIILNNVTIANNNGQYAMRIVSGGTITANNSIIFGTPLIEDGTYTAQNTFTQGNTNTANGNINTSGLSITDVFKSPYAGDFTLKSSLLINKGNNVLFPNLNANTKDLAGNPRLLGSAIDLGAYEFEPISITPTNGIVYVKANGIGNGSGWNSATGDLQAAIDAPGVTKVFVAVGTYPVGSSSFIMKNGVEIYGGFDPGAGITTLAHNRILPNKGMGDGSVLDGENTRPVIWNDNNGLNNTAVLDGFTIKRGYTNSDGGGGIHNKSVSPVFNNLVVRDNSAKEGAGMWNSSSSPVMTNVVFQNNIATAGPGGAMYNMISSTATITNAVFKGNESTQFAGGVMYNFTSSSATLTNVLIVENVATSVAAIVQSVNGNLTLNNVSIFNNNIAQALYVSSNGTATINNSIIFGSVDAGSGGTFSSQNSFLQGNTNAANGNVNTSGLTATDIFTNPSASDYSPKHPSVINKGDNTLFPGLSASTKDLAGNLRLVGTKIDLGAYEYQASIIPDATGIIYVRPTAQGNGDGSSWDDATNDLHNAIHLNGVQKVFAATGNYNVGSSSFIMKNGVEIYGGFNPGGGITNLTHNRILPTESTAGSVLNGENTRPLIWNNDNGLNNTAILDGFTLTNGSGTSGGAIFNVNVAPVFNNLVIKNNTASVSGGAIYNVNSPIKLNNTIITGNTAQYGGGVRNNGSASEFTNVIIKNNTATLATAGAGGGGIFNENSALKLTNVLIANNSTNFQGGGFRNLSGNPIFTNVTIANNTAVNQMATAAIEIAGGNPQINNSIIFGSVSGSYTPQYSMIEGNANFSNGNIAIAGITDVFTNPSGGNYTLKLGSYAVNAGSNALFTGLDANTKDLAGNARVYNFANGGIVDMGAYESTYTPITPTSGIVYVTPNGTGNGSSWANATSDLHTAIQANGVSKVFVAVGNYNVGVNSFIMKNGVEIYGGFDPANGITDLTHNRIMPNATHTNGSILNGEGLRPVIWNVFTSGTAMTGTAVLDGFTIFNGSYSNGAGIRNVYASPTLRNLVIRGNTSTGTGAGIYNENSSPDIYNTVISGNMIIAPFGQSGMGAGVYNGTNSAPTIVNTTIADNTITGIGASPVMVGAGVANLTGANPKIYNSIIWNNQKNGLSNVDGADIESNGASLTLKNSITQKYTTGNSGDNNKVGSDPLFAGADFKLQSNSPAVNAGNNSLYTFSGAFDLAGNQRVSASAIDMGAYEYTLLPDANGIVYVKTDGTGSGATWADATSDLHNAIQTTGVTKVFVAKGNYNVGANSFIMKNGVEIYGGFDPTNGITTLAHNRIMPNAANTNGSVLNGQNARPVIWNVFTSGTAMNNTAVLDGFTVMNGTYDTGGGIRNVYASPTLRNLVIRNNEAVDRRGAGIYNDNSSPLIINSVIYNNVIYSGIGSFGAGVCNVNNSQPTLINCNIIGNKLLGTGPTLRRGAGIDGDAKIYNSIIWDNTQTTGSFGNPDIYGASVVKNSITQEFTTGNAEDNNLVGVNPMFAGATDFSLQAGSPAVNMGNNDWFTGLDANTKDLAGNTRVYHFANGGIMDMGAYESSYNTPLAPDANDIIYVTQNGTGNRSGKDWSNATADLHNAIQTTGVTKVFVAVGNYPVGSSSFIMKNGVEIYGGFDPDNNIKTLADNRILPTETVGGSVLDGENARPVIYNVFTSGTAMDNTAILDGFTIYNGKYSNGGGISNMYASPTLRNLVIKNNNAGNDGGGMYNNNSSPIITKSIFIENKAGNNGGAMVNDYSYPELTNVIIKGNQAGFLGGGITSGFNSSPVLTNVLIVQNTAVTNGGGIYNGAGKGELVNVTIAGNTPNNVSLKIDKIKNSIIFGGVSVNTLTYSFIQGNTDTNNGNINTTGITLNDVFNNPSAGDYTLKSTSPVINKGSNILVAGLGVNTKDLAGNTRVYNFATGGIIDLGAYESPYNESMYGPDANGIIYVKETATGNESGKDWANATGSLTRAIHTNGVSKVFAAVGNYNLNYISIILKNGVEIYGGFDPANGIVDLNTRILPNSDNNTTGSVLSGQNARPVIFNDNNGLNNTAVLDGFTLTNGRYNTGGAIYNNGASPMLRNLWIKGNTADNDGGGIMNINSSSPVMTNITVSGNTAIYGGGVFNRTNSSPVMTNVVIKNNTTAEDGGGMYNDAASSPVMTNVAITGNTAKNGAGMYNRTNSSPSLTNTTIANNTGSTTLYATNGTTSLVNSIVFGVVSGNYAPQYSLIQGNNDFTNGNIDAGSITADNIFTNPSAGDYTLKTGAVVINAGNNTLFTGLDAATKDLAGNARVYDFANGGRIDMGAYEYEPVPLVPDANGVIYVNKAVNSGNASGDSWANAVSELADALKEAKTNTAVKAIYVAKGTYYPMYTPATADVNGVAVTNRDKTFLLVKDVKIYGGFDPENGLNDLSTRNPKIALTTLSGDIGIAGTDADNVYHVVVSAGHMGSAGFDGFTVTRGYAMGGDGGSTYSVKMNNIDIPRFWGGGFYIIGGSPAIANVEVTNNSAAAQGGGIELKDSFSTITNVSISGNHAGGDGGGIFNANASPVLTNVLIYNNSASVRGGGMVNGISSPVLTNVVIANNGSGGLVNHSGSSPLIRNSILYGNAIYDLFNNSITGDHPLISYSLVGGTGGSTAWNSPGSIDDGHNIDTDPQFIDAPNGNYALKVGSPAINSGDNTVFNPGKIPDLSAINTDMAGNVRMADGTIDIGAYESTSTLTPDALGIIYVKTIATGNGSGDSWVNATANLQGAIDAATSQVWVAKGTYTASQNSFKMKNGISIYGGFDPDNSMADLLSRNPKTAVTLLSGMNQRSVIYNAFSAGSPLDNSAVLDGFTITEGNAANGAGIYNSYASPTLRNLFITANHATVSGGGIYNWYASPLLSAMVVSDNTATANGGGIYSAHGDLKLNSTLVKGNEADNGGGIYIFDSNDGLLTDVAITGNTATNTGSAVYSYSGTIRLLNTTIAGNNGNAFNNGTTTFIDNSILYGGIDGLGYTAQYAIIEGVGTSDLHIGTSAIALNQVFSNPAGGDYTLLSSSKAVNAGSNALYAGLDAQTKDLDGNARLYGANIDLGAYELQTAPTQFISPDANSILYVNKSVSGGNGSGDSWANAIPELADALQWADNNRSNWTAATPLSIYVAKGTYLPKYRAGVLDNNNVATTDRDMTFILVKDVLLYGGFDPANSMADMATRNPQQAITTLSGDIGTPGTATDNVYHVVVAAGDLGTAVLNGFTISGGYANGTNSVTMNAKSISRYQGGGVYSNGNAALVAQVRITANSAGSYGGGMYQEDAAVVLTNVLIDRNSAGSRGGGMYNNNASPVLTNVTISNNTLVSNNGGGALYNTSNSAPEIRNSILYGNASPELSNNSSTPVITNSLIQGLNSSVAVNTVFTNAAGYDYSLKAGSPAIDAGDNTLFAGLDANSKDLAGNARVYDFANGGRIDMGAFESPYTAIRPDINHIIYVKTTAAGTGSGNSWANATADLQGAINADGVQQVWVANGTYTVPAVQYFVMKNGVAIYGGFDPDHGIDDLNDARIIPGAGTAAFSGGSVLKGLNNSVINNQFTGADPLLNTAILDGFTLTGGNAAMYGGGINNQNASPVLRNLYITANTAGSDGGAIYNLYSSPVITNVLMSGNDAMVGGAMSNNEGSDPVLSHVVIKGHTASWFGGAVYNFNSSPVFTNVLISSNAAPSGSAVYNEITASPVFTNVTISNNIADDESLMVNSFGSSPEIRNSVIYGNTGTLMMNFSTAEDIPVFSYSLVQGSGGSSAWNTATGNDGGHNIDVDPQFTNAAAGDYSLKTGSPAVNAGKDALFGGLDASTQDLAGKPRVYDKANGGVIDMGAYETQGSALTQTINPIADVVKTYGDTAFEPGATATSGLTVAYSSSDNSIAEAYQDTADSNKWKLRLKKAGSVTITASQPGDSTWPAAANVDFVLTVGQKPVTLAFTAVAVSKTYDGTVAAGINAANLSFTPGDLMNGDDVQVQVGLPGASYDTKDVGVHKIITLLLSALSLSGADAANYRISNTADLSKNAQITQATLTVKAKNASKVYDALPYSGGNGVTYTGFVGSEDENVLGGTLTYTGSSQDAVMAGTYDIIPGGYTSANYAINYVAGNLTISPNAVNTLSFTGQTAGATLNKIYGDAAINAAAVASSGLAVSYSSSNPAVATVDGSGQVTLKGVGSTDIQAQQPGDANYGAATAINITVVVAPKAVTVTAAAQSKVYGDADPVLGYIVSPALIGSDSFTGALSRAVGENVGAYAINQGTLSAGSNYAITYVDADLTIMPKAIDVLADTKSKAFGATDPVLTYTVNGLVGTDAMSGSLTRAAGEAVGVYPISQGSLTAGANYTINYTPADFTIGTNVVTIVAEAKTKVYGDTDPVLTYTVSGLAPGDALTGSLSRATGENTGSYAITQGTLSAGPGYTINYTGANLNITPKAVTVTASIQSKVYGDVDPVLTYTVSGLAPGDALTGSLSRAAGENTGSYAITQGTLSAGSNYTISFTGSNLSITPKAVTVTAAAQSKVYGDADPVLGYIVSPALIGSDSFTGALSRAVGENVGAYAINQGTLSAGSNYAITYVDADLTIMPKAITVIADAKSKTFGATDPVLTYTVNGLVGTDVMSGSLTRAAGETVGVYPISQGSLTAGANYTINYTPADFTIGTNIVTIVAEVKSKVYGDIDPVLTYTVSGLAPGDALTGSLSRAAGENTGSYAITKGTLSAGPGYTINYTGANLNITPKAITVIADAKSKTFGATDPVLTYTVNGLVGTDAMSGSLTRAAGEAVGVYPISQGSLTAGANYTINYTPADFTIGTNVVTIIAEAKTKVYGDTDPVLTYTASGLAPGDVLIGSLSRAAGENTGSYAITQGTLSAGSNYTISFTGSNLSITPKALTVIADTKSKAFGATDPVLTYTVNGLVGTDAMSGSLTRAAGEAVGVYPITQGSLTAGANYTINYTPADFTIGTNVVTIVAEAKTKIYGNTDPVLTYTVSGLAPGDALTGSLSRAAGENTGSYAITQGTLSAGSNYTISFTGSNLSITPKAITVIADAKSKTFGATDPVLTYTVNGLVGTDAMSGSLTRAAGEAVGVYPISQGSLTAGANYTINYTPADFTIGTNVVTIVAEVKSKVYGDIDPVLTYTVSGLAPGDALTGSLNRAAGENTGNYAITQGTLSAGPGYTINYTGANLNITPKAITVIADAKSKTFGATDPVLTYTVNGLVGTDAMSGSLTRAGGEAVGTYLISQGSLTAGANYTINYTPADFTIGTNVVTIVAEAKTKVYGDADPVLTYTVSGLAPGDALTGNLSRAAGENTGSYAITQGTLSAGSNYTISFTGSNLSITPKAVTVTALIQSKVYGDVDPVLSYTVSPALIGSDSFTGALSRAVGENVGTYPITQGTLSAGANYTINFTGVNLSITPKAITVIADAKSKAFGATDPVLTYTVNGLVGTDAMSGSLARATGEAVGTYLISQGSLTAGANYLINYTSADFTIGTNIVTIVAEAKSKVYGDTDPVLTYTVSGLAPGDVLIGSLSRAAGENTGSYAITQGTLSAGSNYTISFTGSNLSITPKALTVIADTKSKAFGATDPVLTYTVNGLVGTDAMSGSLTRAAGEAVGVYPISQGSLTAGANYTINYTPADFTIGINVVTIVAEAKTKVYGDADPVLTYTVIGLAPGDALTGSLSRAAGENTGSYAITQGTLSAGSNYTISFTGSNLSITPKAITVIADAKSKTFGATDPVLTYTVNGLVGTDAMSGSLTRAAGEAVGVYPISQGSLTAGSNYTINYTPADFTIGTNVVTIVAEAKTKVYGDTDPVLTYTVSGLAPGDALTGSLSRAAGENTGSYAITKGTLSAGPGYTIMYVAADLKITPKAITVTADGKSKVYGTSDPILTYTVNGLVGTDTMHGGLSRATGENTGNYAITQGTLSAGANYILTFIPSAFTIQGKELTIIAEAKTKVYGEADPVLTYTVMGLVPGDVLSGSLTRTAEENTGRYAILQGSLSAGVNYTITYVSADLIILPRPLTITADAKTKTYGDSDPVFTYHVNGLLATDQLTGLLNRTAGENAGSYVITQGTLSAGLNYVIHFAGAGFSIEKAPLTVAALSVRLCVGSTFPVFTVSYSGFKNGETESSLMAKPAIATNANAGSAPGIYTLTPSGAVSANYTFNYVTGQFTLLALPQASLESNLGSRTAISRGETVLLTAGGGVRYEWYEGSNQLSDQQSILQVRPVITTTYTVKVYNAGGCSEVKTIVITVKDNYDAVKATNLLTPNGDGVNDYWIVSNIDVFPEHEVRIFDRAGRIVYQKKNYDNSWNGMLNGNPLAEGTYYYLIDFGKDKPKLKGFITILRNK